MDKQSWVHAVSGDIEEVYEFGALCKLRKSLVPPGPPMWDDWYFNIYADSMDEAGKWKENEW